jgi:hypothetical protein
MINPNNPHYYNYHKDEYVCTVCGGYENKQENLFGKRFKYHHNTIFINNKGDTSLLENIDEFKLG